MRSTDWNEKTLEELPLRRLGRYTLLRPIGQGGMAEVYLARAEGTAGFAKDVVVKRIKPVHHANREFVEMFLREARVLSHLDHPNIVKIFELDQEGAEVFLAMEYLQGITLRDVADRTWLQGASLPIELVVRAVADAALGLDHAHRAVDRRGAPLHIIHRDVSPDNLFLTTFGATKVIDFGIAKREGFDQLTAAGEIKGKIPYMSPEQLTAQPLDGRTDLWSLGVCLYWLLGGRRPFDAQSEMQTMRNIVEGAPPPLRRLNPYVPSSLEAVVQWTLHKERAQRPATGQALHDALVRLLAGLPPAPITAQQLVERTLPLPQPEYEVAPKIAAKTTTPWPEPEAPASATAPTRLSMKAADDVRDPDDGAATIPLPPEELKAALDDVRGQAEALRASGGLPPATTAPAQALVATEVAPRRARARGGRAFVLVGAAVLAVAVVGTAAYVAWRARPAATTTAP